MLCGVTQAMMALAAGTGNPLMGAALMASFTLGASPVFFALAYLAARLGAGWEKRFMQVTAVVVLILGLIAIESGLNLVGSPVSFASLTRSLSSAAAQTPTIR
ncbi:MAG: sulfite exporter TauE/SafE family protein [Anaerolineae bacterium]|nr:sulfite exporter TauE/SafE family protein [Anaerolineae bacterium]